MARTIRRSAIAAAMLGVGLVLGGCTATNPITTQYSYAPSDGIRVEVTDRVSVENLLVLTEGEGQPGHVLGAVVNRSPQDMYVSLTLGKSGTAIPVHVPAGGEVNLSAENVTTPSVGVQPGATLPATVGAAGVGEISVEVPVLDGTLPAYKDYLQQHTA